MKRIIALFLAVLALGTFVACTSTMSIERFKEQYYTLSGQNYASETGLMDIGDGKLLICTDKEKKAQLQIVDVFNEKIEEITIKYENGYRYKLRYELYADNGLIFEAYSVNESDGKTQFPSFYLFGKLNSKKVVKCTVPNGNGVFNYNRDMYYYIDGNIIYSYNLESTEEKLIAKFPIGSELSFNNCVDRATDTYNLHVTPENGDNYLCQFKLDSGTVSNPVYQSNYSSNSGTLNGRDVILTYPDYEETLSLTLLLINYEQDKAGTDTMAIDLGSAFGSIDYTPDYGQCIVYNDYIVFVSNATSDGEPAQQVFALGKLEGNVAEFAELSELGCIDDISACCSFTLSDGSNKMQLFAAIIDNKLTIINPNLLDYTIKVPVTPEQYVDIRPLR